MDRFESRQRRRFRGDASWDRRRYALVERRALDLAGHNIGRLVERWFGGGAGDGVCHQTERAMTTTMTTPRRKKAAPARNIRAKYDESTRRERRTERALEERC
jgi:hypothetical protein